VHGCRLFVDQLVYVVLSCLEETLWLHDLNQPLLTIMHWGWIQVEIMMALEEKFEIQLDEDNAEQIVTVQHAADLIQDVVAAKKAWIMSLGVPAEAFLLLRWFIVRLFSLLCSIKGEWQQLISFLFLTALYYKCCYSVIELDAKLWGWILLVFAVSLCAFFADTV